MKNKNSIQIPLTETDVSNGVKRRWIPAERVIEKLQHIKNSPDTWIANKIGGQDQYAGMPSFLRNIDEIIEMLSK